MWFVLQAAIIFGVFCWIGQHVDYIADGKGCQSGTNDSPTHPLPASFGEGGIRRSALAAPFVASSGEVWVDTTGGITAYG
jgi:hypothetical protein